MLYENLSVNEKDHLTFCGLDTVLLAKEFGTPLYLMDEERIRRNMRTYLEAMRFEFGKESLPLFASKALSIKEMYRLAKDEGLGIDTVSCGEIYTALAAGFSPEMMFFHGNNKTDSDIEYAINHGVDFFIADNKEELFSINNFAAKAGIIQKVLLRLTPGIDPHTHKSITTGKIDSKFGIPIENGQAEQLSEIAVKLSNIRLEGYHCHIGSQCFDSEPFCNAAEIMLRFCAAMKEKYGINSKYLNLGGGYGVRYTENQPMIDIPNEISKVAKRVRATCTELGIEMPTVLMEPGRSIVADAGITLYSVGSVKHIPGYKSYVSVDGGMTDNPRYALYNAEYTVINANSASTGPDIVASVVGRCCESGDIIQENVKLKTPSRGDILAVLTTGAYNYSMASEYNKLPKPPIVMISDGKARVVVKRQDFADLIRLEI